MANIEQRYGDQNAGNDIINVSPTLFLGLGGSGKEVLMRLRRLFYSNTRETGLPIHSYFWIDTDPRRQNIKAEDYQNDPISNALYLPQTDYLDAQVASDQIKNYFKRPQSYEHIFQWLHPSVSQLGPEMLKNGAGMVRPCGRLAFFNHFEEIKARLKRKISSISEGNAVNLTQNKGYAVDAGVINVFLAASIAGGTGAGMFLDTAFLLRHIADEMQVGIDITGILFLPSVFKNVDALNGERIQKKLYSNAYAALMELDYYMSPKVGIQLHQMDAVEYDQRNFYWNGTPCRIQSAPFDTVYLIGGENMSGVNLGAHDYDNAFQMTADAVYMEFCRSQFADEKRSIRSNLSSFLLDETRYTEMDADGRSVYSHYYPNRYASFGLSFIKLDTERKRNAAAFFLGQSVADLLCSGQRDDDAVNRDVENVLKLDLLEGEPLDSDPILTFLLTDHQNVNGDQAILEPHEQGVNLDYNDIKNEIAKILDQGVTEGFRRLDRDELETLRVKVRLESDVEAWTDASTQIQKQLQKVCLLWGTHTADGERALQPGGKDRDAVDRNTEALKTAIDNAVETEFYKILASPGSKGVDYADAYCEGILRRINSIDLNLSKRPALGFTIDSKQLEKGKRLLEIEAFLISSQRIRAPLYGKTARRHYSAQYAVQMKQYKEHVKTYLHEIISNVQGQLREWFRVQYSNDALGKFAIIREQIIAKIQRFKRELNHYRNGLRELGESQQRWYDAYNQDQSDIRYHYIGREIGTRDWYQDKVIGTLRPLHAHGAALDWSELRREEVIEFFNTQYRLANWAPQCFDIFGRHEADEAVRKEFEDRLNHYCFYRMQSFMADMDAERAFTQDGTIDQRGRVLQQICAAADVWVKKSNRINFMPQQRTYIGASHRQTPTGNEVRNNIAVFQGAGGMIHDPSSVIFYREIAAFPIFYLHELDECYRRYASMTEDLHEIYRRHLNYREMNRLRMIRPPEDQQEAIDLFISGMIIMESLILGCLKYDEGKGNFWFESEPFANIERYNLGSTLDATIRMMKADNLKRDELISRMEEKRSEWMRRKGVLFDLIMLKIIQYYVLEVFKTVQRAGHLGTTTYDTNKGLIVQNLQRKYIDKLLVGGKFLSRNELGAAVGDIAISSISDAISYKDVEAYAPLRVLSVPGEGGPNEL